MSLYNTAVVVQLDFKEITVRLTQEVRHSVTEPVYRLHRDVFSCRGGANEV